MKYSLCIGAYPGKDALYHLEKIKEHEFQGLEYYNWWQLDLEKTAQVIERTGVFINAICTPVFNLVDENNRKAYINGIKETIEAARILNTKSIITQTGNVIADIPRIKQEEVMVETLKQCAYLCEEADITLEIEPLNGLVDHPGHFLQTSKESANIIERVDSSHVKLVFDVYHQQITEGNIISNIKEYYESINHFHIADNPGRTEAGTGELNFINILRTVRDLDYQGYIGLEGRYTIDTDKAIDQFKKQIIAKI